MASNDKVIPILGRPFAALGESPSNAAATVARPRASSAPAAPDYAALLERIAAGDRAAEEELIGLLSTPLDVVLRQRARGLESVDDLRQDTLMAVLVAAREGRVRDPQALVAYALETARRLALNADRKERRQCTDTDSALISVLADDSVDIPTLLGDVDMHGCIEAVLSTLPQPRDRQLLVDYYLQEQPSARIQAEWAMTSGQLGRVLHRARRRFGALWRALRFDPPDF